MMPDTGRLGVRHLLLIVERAGYPEESHFTLSYSPIKGRVGGVGGVFCACSETTARVLAERRRITLHRLGMISVSEASTALTEGVLRDYANGGYGDSV
jgi:hypothetical protein